MISFRHDLFRSQTTFSSTSGRRRGDALIAERVEVEARVAAVDYQLGKAAADGRRLLQAVARKAGGNQQVGEAGQGTDDRVLVECVEVVMAGPGAAGLDRLEGRHARRENRPDRLLEEGMVDVEVGRRRIAVGGRRGAADIEIALRPHIDAGWIDHQRKAGQGLAAGEGEDHALARLDRQHDADVPGKGRRAGAGGKHHRARRDHCAIDEPDAGRALAGLFDRGDLGRKRLDAERARLAP